MSALLLPQGRVSVHIQRVLTPCSCQHGQLSDVSAPSALQARQCLKVLPDSVAARQELDDIDGFCQLSEWGIQMLPLQFHQVIPNCL